METIAVNADWTRDQSTGTLVERMLEILQMSALSQSGQAHCLQGPGLGGLSDDRSVECVHVPATKLLSL